MSHVSSASNLSQSDALMSTITGRSWVHISSMCMNLEYTIFCCCIQVYKLARAHAVNKCGNGMAINFYAWLAILYFMNK